MGKKAFREMVEDVGASGILGRDERLFPRCPVPVEKIEYSFEDLTSSTAFTLWTSSYEGSKSKVG